jgi:hypothetical protein
MSGSGQRIGGAPASQRPRVVGDGLVILAFLRPWASAARVLDPLGGRW